MVPSNSEQKTAKGKRVSQKTQKSEIEINKESIKEFVKKKLRLVHQEIIAPPGE